MASTGGGAARSSKKRDPDVAGQDGAPSAILASIIDDPLVRIEGKIDTLVNSIQLSIIGGSGSHRGGNSSSDVKGETKD
jgi:hypothetical protein